jgi:hypothetical protein
VKGTRSWTPLAKNQQPVWRAYAVHLLNQQTLSRDLQDVRRLWTTGVPLLLDRDQRTPRPQQMVRSPDQAEAIGAEGGYSQPSVIGGDDAAALEAEGLALMACPHSEERKQQLGEPGDGNHQCHGTRLGAPNNWTVNQAISTRVTKSRTR